MYNTLKEKLSQYPYSSALESFLWILTQTSLRRKTIEWNSHGKVYWVACRPAIWATAQFSSVPQLCLTLSDPWTTAHQATLSLTNSQSLLKLMSIELVMPSNHLIFCRPFLLLHSNLAALGSFPVSQFLISGGRSIGVSASASVLPMNIQDWFPLGLTWWISLQSKGLSRVFSNTMNIHAQVFAWMYVFNSLGYTSMSRIAGTLL